MDSLYFLKPSLVFIYNIGALESAFLITIDLNQDIFP